MIDAFTSMSFNTISNSSCAAPKASVNPPNINTTPLSISLFKLSIVRIADSFDFLVTV